MTIWKNVLLGLVCACVFVLLYAAGALTPMEDSLYDYFLRFRSNRQRIDNVVFLDVDDAAIAYNGFYPWPRSIPADGLLRLKEHGVRAAIFDIEYVDRGPQGVDSLYLGQGLGNDFDRGFSEINGAAQEIFSAIGAGRVKNADVNFYANSFASLVSREHEELYARAQNVARDNDLYLAQAVGLIGAAWSTLNLRDSPLSGEQAERRSIAEERFAYPVSATPDAWRGAGFVDILPALPMFAQAAKGAGFTNVEIDHDGVRRRIYLAQNIFDKWYLQLAFAPLVDSMGRPDITLTKRKLTIKDARLPSGEKKTIVIPLDQKGRMMLDWPKEDFHDSYKHISFTDFSLLDEIEAEMEKYARALSSADFMLFSQFDESLYAIPIFLGDMEALLDMARAAKTFALEHKSDDSFDDYINCRNKSYELLAKLLALDAGTKVQALALQLGEEYPQDAAAIRDEAGYIAQLAEILQIDLDRWNELSASVDKAVRGKFCILGRVDTGTTDYGANPFYGKYVNVGTHGVVLDTILSETFIIPLSRWTQVLVMLLFIQLFLILSARLPPVIRAASGFVITSVFVAVTAALFRFFGIFLGPLGTVFALVSAVIIREIISYAGSEKEKQFIRTAFSTYVSGDVVKEIISDPSRLQLGGSKRHMTAIFTDVMNFTTIAEKLEPEDLVHLLNQYLSAMSDVILAEKGTIDKYEGDAIIAFFGAPLDLSDHALRACISAVKMKKIEEELNKTVLEKKLSPAPLVTRIGINTGSMVAGNMGTENKMNYTIMGNAVNLAARLEGVNKQYGTWILASYDTARETGDRLLWRKLDRARVVGISEPVRLCELLDTAEYADEQKRKLVAVFHEALDYFEKREWKQAAAGYKEALAVKPGDLPSKIYFERSVNYVKNPPPDAWDGVYNITEK
ncbi:MAG: CHASE2 domain-containing protein [Treponema sp.]|jgi:adenylate cyclase|nr:CHASE2 domain-containing protein [Treponema sp.]